MLRLTLAQMRRSLGRLAAAGVAIALGAGFVAAALLAGDVITRTTYDAVSSGFADADLVVTGETTDPTRTALEQVPGVASVHGHAQTWHELRGPDGVTVVALAPAAQDPRLQPGTLVSGRMPEAAGEVALAVEAADVLGAEPGTSVRLDLESWSLTEDGDDEAQRRTDELTVVGVVEMPEAAFLATGGFGVVTAEQFRSWEQFLMHEEEPETWYEYLTIAVEPGASVADVEATAAAALPEDSTVRTKLEQAQRLTAEVTGEARLLVAVVLGFAAVALLVAGLVIANTFQVLVAQRTRMLALLRCVGAERSQLRRSVVLEALVLGLGASTAGLLLALALGQLTLVVLGRTWAEVPLPATIAVTPALVLVPLAIGTLVTVVASLAPAVAATRVPPLAALRPTGTPALRERSGRVRAIAAGLLTLGGAGGLALGVVVAQSSDLVVGLVLGLLGGATSFVGIVLGAVFWVPRLIGGSGRLVARAGGPAARLAAANSVRNPRRTAATSSALFIGVTLVAMMATGAATARTALTSTLEEQFPVDIAVGTLGDGVDMPALPSGFAAEAADVAGVTTVTELTGTSVAVAEGIDPSYGDVGFLEMRGVDPAAGRAALHEPEYLEGLDAEHVVVPANVAGWYDIATGDRLTFVRQETPAEWAEGGATEGGDEGGEVPAERTAGAEPADPGTSGAGTSGAGTSGAGTSGAGTDEADAGVTLTAVVTALPGTAVVVTPDVVQGLDADAPVSRLWIRLESPDVARAAVSDITAAASATDQGLETVGAAVERAFYQQVVDTLLAVVVGLLGVAVVIAVVGVANTLSLSVLERRRESATLRAIGLSRAQLRGTLAVEGTLIAGVGAVVGVVLGALYGWAGAAVLLSTFGPVTVTVPWGDLGLVALVALLAGLLASVLPGRRAARTSPVAALAVE